MFTNRIAIVTGGGSGIGRAVCKLFAKQNASVVIADMNLSGAQETQQLIDSVDRHLAVQTDVSKSDSVKQLFDAISKRYDNNVATILVNCAGITRDGFLTSISEEDFDRVIGVNLKGTFLTTKMCCQLMVEKKVTEGSIINVSSVSAKIGNLGQCNYVASKSAVEGFTRTVAREMAGFNIRCNAVMPGFIDTPIISTVPQKVIDLILKQIPMARIGKPEEVAEVIEFLASTKSSYITGTTIQVTGGMAM